MRALHGAAAARIAVAILSPVVLFAVAVFVLIVAMPLYYHAFAVLSDPHRVVENRFEIAEATVWHVLVSTPLDYALFSASEQYHLADIKVLAGRAVAVVLFLASVFIAAAVYLHRQRRSELYHLISTSLLASIPLCLLLAMTATMYFDAVFDLAHRLLFRGGNWQFDPATDALIVIFPPQFFNSFFFAAFASYAAVAAAIGMWLRWRNDHSSKSTYF